MKKTIQRNPPLTIALLLSIVFVSASCLLNVVYTAVSLFTTGYIAMLWEVGSIEVPELYGYALFYVIRGAGHLAFAVIVLLLLAIPFTKLDGKMTIVSLALCTAGSTLFIFEEIFKLLFLSKTNSTITVYTLFDLLPCLCFAMVLGYAFTVKSQLTTFMDKLWMVPSVLMLAAALSKIPLMPACHTPI